MKPIWLVLSLIVLALPFLLTTNEPQAVAAIEKKPVVYTQMAKLEELSEILTYPARIEPRIKASVVAEADGIVTKIIAPLGSSVRANAPLLVMRNTDPVYQYSPMVVTSTVVGVVSRVEVTEGSRVQRGDKLLLVTDPDQLRVVVEVTAQDLGFIKPGMMAEIKMPGAATGAQLRVKGLSPFVDPATGTASCELEIDKPKGPTKAASKNAVAARLPALGQIGRVFFKANVRSAISVPDSAITYRGKDPYVRLVDQGKAKMVAVVIGRKEAGSLEILKGLKAGDQFIERASGFVADGEAVEVQPNEKSGDKKTGPADGQPS